MPITDPIEILLAHNQWATEQILNACAALTPEQFHQRFDMGPGSLHDTLTHILGALRVWTELLAGRTETPRLEATKHSLEELNSLLKEISADITTAAKAHPLEGTVTRVRNGKSYILPRSGVLVHITTHGMHHRAQCLNMLRQLGINPLPPSSVVEWMIQAGSAR